MASMSFIALSRVQFVTTAAFHMTFPALSVALAIFLVICYACHCKTDAQAVTTAQQQNTKTAALV